jgi:hypothetical protein
MHPCLDQHPLARRDVFKKRLLCSEKASPLMTLEGIARYLGSGMIRGIGTVYVRRLVQAFGELGDEKHARPRAVMG